MAMNDLLCNSSLLEVPNINGSSKSAAPACVEEDALLVLGVVPAVDAVGMLLTLATICVVVGAGEKENAFSIHGIFMRTVLPCRYDQVNEGPS